MIKNMLKRNNKNLNKSDTDVILKSKNTDLSMIKNKVVKIKNRKSLEYVVLKVIPDKTIVEEQKTYFIAKAIYSLNEIKITKSLENDDGSPLRIREENRITYIIDMTSKSVNFYFYIQKEIADLLKEKIYQVFTNCKIVELESYSLPKEENSECNSIEYKYNDTFSLNTDVKIYNLEELISNSKWLTDDDRIVILFNFTKVNLREFDKFKEHCFRLIKNKSDKYNFLNNKLSSEYITEKIMSITSSTIDTVFDIASSTICGDYNEKIEERINRRKINVLEEISLFTRDKVYSPKLQNEIVVISYSKDTKKRLYNLRCVTDTFSILADENELIAQKSKMPILSNTNWGNKKNIMCLKEISKFLILPNKEILNDYKDIEQIAVRQSQSFDFVKNGNFYLGENDYKGIVDDIYLPSDYDSESLGLVLLAPQGGGKTTLMTNLAINSANKGQANVVIDYIKNCEFTTNIIKGIKDKSKLVIINAEDINSLPSLDFNEYKISFTNDPIEKGRIISNKVDATTNIINTLNEEQPLTANMAEILGHASQIIYSFEDTDLGNLVDFLTNYEYRQEIIEKAEKLDFKNKILNKKLKEAIKKIDILNEYGKGSDKNIVIGTNSSKINGIIARINKLKSSFTLYNMLFGECKPINFVKLLDEGKTILVQLPEHAISESEKNVISTFITLKTILAIRQRGATALQPLRSNLWIDEIYQVPTVENVIKRDLSRLRKYGLKVIISVHRMSQLSNKKFQDELLGSGASFTFLRGCKEIQLKEFTDIFNASEFTFEDVYNLKPFHALHIINSNKEGNWIGITKLPPPTQ